MCVRPAWRRWALWQLKLSDRPHRQQVSREGRRSHFDAHARRRSHRESSSSTTREPARHAKGTRKGIHEGGPRARESHGRRRRDARGRRRWGTRGASGRRGRATARGRPARPPRHRRLPRQVRARQEEHLRQEGRPRQAPRPHGGQGEQVPQGAGATQGRDREAGGFDPEEYARRLASQEASLPTETNADILAMAKRRKGKGWVISPPAARRPPRTMGNRARAPTTTQLASHPTT